MISSEIIQDGFIIVGLQVRTTNAKEMTAEGKIPALWSQFYSEQTALKVPHKTDESVFAIYHDYESDANGEYTLTIGYKVKPGLAVPSGLVQVVVPPQKYMKFTTSVGEMPMIIIEGWQQIWKMTANHELNRKYSADFEVYDHRCVNPKASQADIFIAVE